MESGYFFSILKPVTSAEVCTLRSALCVSTFSVTAFVWLRRLYAAALVLSTHRSQVATQTSKSRESQSLARPIIIVMYCPRRSRIHRVNGRISAYPEGRRRCLSLWSPGPSATLLRAFDHHFLHPSTTHAQLCSLVAESHPFFIYFHFLKFCNLFSTNSLNNYTTTFITAIIHLMEYAFTFTCVSREFPNWLIGLVTLTVDLLTSK